MAIKHMHMGFVWRGCLLLGLSLGLSLSAAQAPPPCPVQPDPSCKDLKAPEAMVRMMSSGPAEECTRDDDSWFPFWNKCKFKIKVVAATKDMPRCWAYLPYSALKVASAKRDRTVSWTIDPAVPDHEFDGAEGIKLTAVPGSVSSPAGTWAKHTSSSSQKFKLTLVDQTPAEFCHYPQVKGPKEMCCPADPVIANEP